MRLALLGSTGSIGRQVLELAAVHEARFPIVALSAGHNAELLLAQALRFRPPVLHLASHAAAERLRASLPNDYSPRVLAGEEALEEVASLPEVDCVVAAVAGFAGLRSALAAVRRGKRLAIANKEPLVAAGELLMREAAAAGAEVLPIDSEHSAIFQCLMGESTNSVAKLYLTASGGAFRDKTRAELAAVTPEQALAHPTWKMGAKVTIDSATLFNKGLEVIEAHRLFGFTADQIQVVIHRESIVHSAVEFVDGSIKAQLSLPDMRFPILLALSYPERLPNPFPRLDLAQAGSLSFAPVELERFPALGLAFEALRRGGTAPAAISAADEVAVEAFITGRIGFLVIREVLEAVLAKHSLVQQPSLDDILRADEEARSLAWQLVESLTR